LQYLGISVFSMVDQQSALRSIGKYEILGTLGRGSMGIVYKARDPEIGRIVAVKTLRKIGASHFQNADMALERFRIEARSAGNLRHPNLITIFEINRDGDTPYIVMDYVEGESLDSLLGRLGKLPPARMLSVIGQVARGLDYAHAKGVVHRDIKPANILVDANGTVFVLDFGVATISGSLGEDEDPAAANLVMGTPGYMSPEQILNEQKLDARSDLFALAVVTFECLTGQRPFPGDNFTAVVGNILEAKPLSLTMLAPELPLALEVELNRALAKKRDQRFGSGREMLEAFASALGSKLSDEGRQNHQEQSVPKRNKSEWTTLRPSNAVLESEPRSEGSKPQDVSPSSHTFSRTAFGQVYERPGEIFSHADGTKAFRTPRYGRASPRILPIIVGLACLVLGVGLILYALSEPPQRSIAIPTPEAIQPTRPENFTGLVPPPVHAVPPNREIAELSDSQLLGAVMSPTETETRLIQALRELSRRRSSGALEASVVPLENDSYVVRVEAIKTLADLGDKRAVQYLLPRLDDHDPIVRAQAVRAIASLGDRGVLAYLNVRLLKEDNDGVKGAIKQAINALSGFTSAP
jgi:serine/threonine protein kinase